MPTAVVVKDGKIVEVWVGCARYKLDRPEPLEILLKPELFFGKYPHICAEIVKLEHISIQELPEFLRKLYDQALETQVAHETPEPYTETIAAASAERVMTAAPYIEIREIEGRSDVVIDPTVVMSTAHCDEDEHCEPLPTLGYIITVHNYVHGERKSYVIDLVEAQPRMFYVSPYTITFPAHPNFRSRLDVLKLRKNLMPYTVAKEHEFTDLYLDVFKRVKQFVYMPNENLYHLVAAYVLVSYIDFPTPLQPSVRVVGHLGSGKTQLAMLLACLCRNAIFTSGITYAAMALLGDMLLSPTLVIDEMPLKELEDFLRAYTTSGAIRIKAPLSQSGRNVLHIEVARGRVVYIQQSKAEFAIESRALESRFINIPMLASNNYYPTPTLDYFYNLRRALYEWRHADMPWIRREYFRFKRIMELYHPKFGGRIADLWMPILFVWFATGIDEPFNYWFNAIPKRLDIEPEVKAAYLVALIANKEADTNASAAWIDGDTLVFAPYDILKLVTDPQGLEVLAKDAEPVTPDVMIATFRAYNIQLVPQKHPGYERYLSNAARQLISIYKTLPFVKRVHKQNKKTVVELSLQFVDYLKQLGLLEELEALVP